MVKDLDMYILRRISRLQHPKGTYSICEIEQTETKYIKLQLKVSLSFDNPAIFVKLLVAIFRFDYF